MARILGRKRDASGVAINNLTIADRSALADTYNGVSTNPNTEDWKNVKVDRVWYNTGAAGQHYGKWWDSHIIEPFMDPNGISTGVLNKSWRALILIKRAAGVPNDPSDKGKKFDPARSQKLLVKKDSRELEVKNGKSVTKGTKVFKFQGGVPENGVSFIENQNTKMVSDWLLNNNNQIIIYNTSISPYEYLVIQNRPNQLDFKGETSWATIKSMGRNTPIYQYTGAEDTLQFNISWFNTKLDEPEEVISKCRLLESWSKANGYNTAPPILHIQWGGVPDNHLFINQDYILISATYSLRNFNNGVRKSNIVGGNKSSVIHDLGLWPAVATQELIFKRVSSHNLTYEDILPNDKKNKVINK